MIIHAESKQLKQVFLNLFLNAVDAIDAKDKRGQKEQSTVSATEKADRSAIEKAFGFAERRADRHSPQSMNKRQEQGRQADKNRPEEKIADRKDIKIAMRSVNQSVSISIKDTGKGISQEDLKHIFEPFYTKKEKGTGLGLFIVYTIIQNHKGTIKAISSPATGTEFLIILPKS